MASKDDSGFHGQPRNVIQETFLNDRRELYDDEDEVSVPEKQKLLQEDSGIKSTTDSPLSQKNNLSRNIEADYSFASGTSCCLGLEHLNIGNKSTQERFIPDDSEVVKTDVYKNDSVEFGIQNLNYHYPVNCLKKEYLEKELFSSERANFSLGIATTPKLVVDLPSQKKVKRSKLAKEGQDIADLIVGSHRAMDYLLSFYNEWTTTRTESLSLLRQLREVIHSSCKNSNKVDDVIACIDLASGTVDKISHPTVFLGGKIAAALGRVFTHLFSSKMSKEDIEAKELEIRQTFQKDIDSSSSVYIFGIQCSSQFEETRQAIKSFHHTVESGDFATVEDDEALQFLNEILEYNPGSMTVFYRRLRSCYERLIRKSKSDKSRAFVKVFDDFPEAVQVIDLLPWRFETDSFDNTVVNDAWKKLFNAFNKPESFDIKLFLRNIENCMFFLNKEQAILERAVIGLLIKKV